ncbi:MAG: ATPase P [Ruminococcus sp.]|nr:ATPase P [Ruminococcus sp.]
MFKITATVEGMSCGMCEAHVNDTIRNELKVKRVSSSHSKNETVIISKEDISDEKLGEIITKSGYTFSGAKHEPYEKKGLFSK